MKLFLQVGSRVINGVEYSKGDEIEIPSQVPKNLAKILQRMGVLAERKPKPDEKTADNDPPEGSAGDHPSRDDGDGVKRGRRARA
jgi:hypothetical protein